MTAQLNSFFYNSFARIVHIVGANVHEIRILITMMTSYIACTPRCILTWQFELGMARVGCVSKLMRSRWEMFTRDQRDLMFV